MQAAVLDVKLRYLDEYNNKRKEVATYYNEAFKNNAHLTVPYIAKYSSHVYHQYTLVLDRVDRNALLQYLNEHQVPAMIYYPVPAHKQKMFAKFGGNAYNLPVTDWLSERVVSLPIHTELDNEQLQHITTQVLNFVNR